MTRAGCGRVFSAAVALLTQCIRRSISVNTEVIVFYLWEVECPTMMMLFYSFRFLLLKFHMIFLIPFMLKFFRTFFKKLWMEPKVFGNIKTFSGFYFIVEVGHLEVKILFPL